MKYELLKDETKKVGMHTLHRIRALRDFRYAKKGTLGGWVESEENLSHDGDCWVSDEACAYFNATVKGDAHVVGNAIIGGYAFVDGHVYIGRNALVDDYAHLTDDVHVSGNSYVGGNAYLSEKAFVEGNVRVFENARVKGNVYIEENAWVFGYAQIDGHVSVKENARISGNARVISGNVCDGGKDVIIRGNSKILLNAYITSNDDYIVLGPLGSRSGDTTFYVDKDRNILVTCGCFNGTIEAFEKRVKETHGDSNLYGREYMCAINYAKNHFALF